MKTKIKALATVILDVLLFPAMLVASVMILLIDAIRDTIINKSSFGDFVAYIVAIFIALIAGIITGLKHNWEILKCKTDEEYEEVCLKFYNDILNNIFEEDE